MKASLNQIQGREKEQQQNIKLTDSMEELEVVSEKLQEMHFEEKPQQKIQLIDSNESSLSMEEREVVSKNLQEMHSEKKPLVRKLSISSKNTNTEKKVILNISGDGQSNGLILSEIIGKGSYGKVKKGQTLDGKIVAAKIQKPRTKEEIEAIQEENKILDKLGELVNQCSLTKEKNNNAYLIEYSFMEFGAGKNLLDLIFKCKLEEDGSETLADDGSKIYDFKKTKYNIRDNSVNERERCKRLLALVDISLEYARAVNHVHQKGVIHRDIKLENFLYDAKTKKGKIVDFGFAREINSTLKDCKGTPMYMAPEIWLKKEHSVASDIYALGVVFALMANNDYLDIEDYNLDTLWNDLENGGIDYQLENLLFVYGIYCKDFPKGEIETAARTKYFEIIKQMISADSDERPEMAICLEVLLEVRNQLRDGIQNLIEEEKTLEEKLKREQEVPRVTSNQNIPPRRRRSSGDGKENTPPDFSHSIVVRI